MKISTKTLASLLTATVAQSSELSRGAMWRRKARFDRLLQRHDRKGELRAELLGESPEEFRLQHKKLSLDMVVRKRGFLNEQEFNQALIGKIRAELRGRGWTARRIDSYVEQRKQRFV